MGLPQIILDIAQLVTLALGVIELRRVRTAQVIGNQLEITKQHREIWSPLEESEHQRIFERDVDIVAKPISNQESLVITFLINHLKVSFRASQAKMLVPSEAMEKDVRWFFSLPIPKEVWNRSKDFQDRKFRSFVESAIAHPESKRSL